MKIIFRYVTNDCNAKRGLFKTIIIKFDLYYCNAFLQPLLEALVASLSAEPRVAANVCWAFTSLAEAAYEAAEENSEDTPQTYCLSRFFDPIVQKLLETTDRPDAATGMQSSIARTYTFAGLPKLFTISFIYNFFLQPIFGQPHTRL